MHCRQKMQTLSICRPYGYADGKNVRNSCYWVPFSKWHFSLYISRKLTHHFWAPGLVNFVSTLACHFFLNLPAAFTQPGAFNRYLYIRLLHVCWISWWWYFIPKARESHDCWSEMDFDNKTNNNKLEDGCSIEVLFRDHHIALFSACLVSLILGFPLAWNILWHLRVWFITTDEALVRFLIVHSHNFTHEENCD